MFMNVNMIIKDKNLRYLTYIIQLTWYAASTERTYQRKLCLWLEGKELKKQCISGEAIQTLKFKQDILMFNMNWFYFTTYQGK